MRVVLGIDTSCYMTSVALCAADDGGADGPFFQQRQLLTVAQGERGLMQSEAVFQHVSRLPGCIEKLLAEHPQAQIVSVCASVRPRPQADSYMPVFRVGEGTGRAIASALRVPFFETTHQQGHLRAARVDTALQAENPHLALHLSGGTTEVLLARDLDIALLGGTADLHAGQLIDRIGVAMGLSFPAGPQLEQLAMRGESQARLPASVQGLTCHFSGAETQALRWIQAGTQAPEVVAAEVFDCVARTVSRLILAGCEQAQVQDALLGGGVASSALIREAVAARVAKRNRAIRLHFARPELSGDNAVGVALIGKDMRLGGQG